LYAIYNLIAVTYVVNARMTVQHDLCKLQGCLNEIFVLTRLINNKLSLILVKSQDRQSVIYFHSITRF